MPDRIDGLVKEFGSLKLELENLSERISNLETAPREKPVRVDPPPDFVTGGTMEEEAPVEKPKAKPKKRRPREPARAAPQKTPSGRAKRSPR